MKKSAEGRQVVQCLLAQKNAKTLSPAAREIYEKYVVSRTKNHDDAISLHPFNSLRPSDAYMRR